MKNRICTILGGGGFIGRYLVRNLTKKNYRCIITTRKAFQKGYLKTQATPGAIELLDWNPNNFKNLEEAIYNLDIIKNNFKNGSENDWGNLHPYCLLETATFFKPSYSIFLIKK